MQTKIYIDYGMIFSDEPFSIHDYLKNIDRHMLICVAMKLIYSGDMFSEYKAYCADFFCAGNNHFANDCCQRLYEHIREKKEITNLNPSATYILTSQSTALELLRQTFAIEISDFATNVPQILQEQYLFKAILLINQTIGYWEESLEYESKGGITDLYVAKSLICSTLNNFESSNLRVEYVAMLQIIKGYHFFKYCENSKVKEHLSEFLTNNNVKSWQEYLYNAMNLIMYPLQNKNGSFPVIALNSNRDGEMFLRAHSFKEETLVSLAENMDYTYFKTHPLIEMKDGTYVPISTTFCINHIYKSVYFELRRINDTFKDTPNYLKGQDLLRILTTEFSEQTLFDEYIRNTLHKHHGIKLSDKDCKQRLAVGNEPDFYCRDGNNIMLFENKDIKIRDNIISSKRYDLLEKELHKKLIDEKGLPQLICNIKQIENKTFKWDSHIPNHPKIYPILVIDDSALCVPGLNYILNEEFQKQLKDNNIKVKVYPLAIVELDTLITFSNYFYSSGVRFNKLLEQYYKYISGCKRTRKIEQIMREVYYKHFPFYIFISQEVTKRPFDNIIFENICDELRETITLSNSNA